MKVCFLILSIILVTASSFYSARLPSVLVSKCVTSGNKSSQTKLYSESEDIDAVVKKSGFEVGMFKALTSKDKESLNLKPKDLLAKYGGAYLITSICLAIISYATCFLLVDKGIDVGALLEKVGIKASATSSTTGTAAIAYVFHKAASPIRFPPTVALTPVVAELLGKKASDSDEKASD